MTTSPLGAGDIRALLDDLADELVSRGVRAEMFLVGGAAISFAYNTRRSTRDVDAVFEPKETVRDAAAMVADRRGIPRDWLNDAVKGYLPGVDQDRRRAIDRPGLSVDVASPRYLLAMKLLAAREGDIEDIRTLYQVCEFSTAEEGLDLLEASYPRHLIPPRAQYILEDLYPRRSNADEANASEPRN